MKNNYGTGQSKITGVLLILGIAIVAGVIVSQKTTNEQVAKETHAKAIDSLKIALEHANNIIHKNAEENQVSKGKADITISSIPVSLINGYLKASRLSLENGLNIVYNAQQDLYSAVSNWNMDIIDVAANMPGKVKIYEPSAPKNCYLIYTEAGTLGHPKQPIESMVKSGC
ncbi:hypothetical protein [Parashewanella tropica]|uniref:hypothetical protein n=1 Tax=Parashewanella tropica TaxID=2547970 RepID=UPI0010598EA3|nr:hypothetical protein [Parashewanella tropica]